MRRADWSRTSWGPRLALVPVALAGACGSRGAIPGAGDEPWSGGASVSPEGQPSGGAGVSFPSSGAGGAASEPVASAGAGGLTFDLGSITDPRRRRRYEACAPHCEVIAQAGCGAADFEGCLRSCAEHAGACASAMLRAFECLAGDVEHTLLCRGGEPTVACGPCEEAFARVERRCDGDTIACRNP